MTSAALIDAVRIGNEAAAKLNARKLMPDHAPDIGRAYNGSLDAARRLHEALLPGWFFAISPNGSVGVWERHEDIKTFWEYDEQHSRAWLLAILRARHD